MTTIAAGDFKARCLSLMDTVAASGGPIVITKRGKPVAQLAPIKRRPSTLRGFLKGTFAVRGDIVTPLDVEEHGIHEIALTGDVGVSAGSLRGFHGDPADRLIAATAAEVDATLFTADDALLSWRGGLKSRDARR